MASDDNDIHVRHQSSFTTCQSHISNAADGSPECYPNVTNMTTAGSDNSYPGRYLSNARRGETDMQEAATTNSSMTGSNNLGIITSTNGGMSPSLPLPSSPLSDAGDTTPTTAMFAPLRPDFYGALSSSSPPPPPIRKSSARHSVDLSQASPSWFENGVVQVPERRSSRSNSMIYVVPHPQKQQQEPSSLPGRSNDDGDVHGGHNRVNGVGPAFWSGMAEDKSDLDPMGTLDILSSQTSRGDGSATPPPISKPRRYIYDDYEEEEAEEDDDDDEKKAPVPLRREDMPLTPATVVRHDDENEIPLRPAALRRHCLASSPAPVIQPAPRQRRRADSTTNATTTAAAAAAVAATPITDPSHTFMPLLYQNRLYTDAETQSRNGSSMAVHHIPWDVESISVKKSGSVSSGRRGLYTHRRAYSTSDTAAAPVSRPTSQHYEPRHDSMSHHPHPRKHHKTSDRLPNFFSQSVFQTVLRNPATTHQLLKFSDNQFCSENVEFLKKVEMYQMALNDLAAMLTDIHKTFISNRSPSQINVPGYLMKTAHSEIKSMVKSTLPSMGTVFDEMQKTIEQLIFTSVYPRFVNYQLSRSASRALASNRSSIYQGLGDCFCLSDPLKADNPVVFASDGFVKVTGYGRPEIIPRNCRFLQGTQTDRSCIQRIKTAIAEKREVVELILNYKKSGEPFWNLLYVGRVAFYLGGQINCSATIHSNVDVMRVLSTSETDGEDTTTPAASAPAPPPSQRVSQRSSSITSAGKALLLRAFRGSIGSGGSSSSSSGRPSHSNSKSNSNSSANGTPDHLEQHILDRMEGLDLDTQKHEFYTAYSRYIVARADSFVIYFYSEGVRQMLLQKDGLLVVGQSVFRFLKRNMLDSRGHLDNIKSRVRGAVRAGQATSLDVRLQTRRSAKFRGDELFKTYFTPLKDENAVTHWVVITLVPTMM